MDKQATPHADDESTHKTIRVIWRTEGAQHLIELFDETKPWIVEAAGHDQKSFSIELNKDGVTPVKILLAASGLGHGDTETSDLFDMFEKQQDGIAYIVSTAKPINPVYGPIAEEGSLDGILTGVTCNNETAYLELQDGDIKHTEIESDIETARRIAKHIFEPVRISGIGNWFRDETGKWVMVNFTADNFIVLDNSSLTEVIEKMRMAFKDSDLAKMDNPFQALKALRDSNNELDL